MGVGGSRRETTPIASATKPRSLPCAAPTRSSSPPARPSDAGSTAGATAKPTPLSTASHSAVSAGTAAPRTTCSDASPKAKHAERSSAASNATSHARSTDSSFPAAPQPSSLAPPKPSLDIHRGISTQEDVPDQTPPRERIPQLDHDPIRALDRTVGDDRSQMHEIVPVGH